MVKPTVRLRLNACRALLGISDTMNRVPFRDYKVSKFDLRPDLCLVLELKCSQNMCDFKWSFKVARGKVEPAFQITRSVSTSFPGSARLADSGSLS